MGTDRSSKVSISVSSYDKSRDELSSRINNGRKEREEERERALMVGPPFIGLWPFACCQRTCW